MDSFGEYRTLIGSVPHGTTQATVFRSSPLLLGLNCLEAGQAQLALRHADQDKFALLLEGEGDSTLGEEPRRLGAGVAVWAPAGVDHALRSLGSGRLVLLVGIAPVP